MPVEVDVSIRRPNWFWSTGDAGNLLSLDDLVEIYYRSVGRGAQLLLNVPPDRTGRIPEADAARAREFGDEIRRRFSSPVGVGSATGRGLTMSFDTPRRVDHVVLQEAINQGERIRGWRLDGFAWEHWHTLAAGTAIGQKRILPIPPDGYSMLRFTVTDAVDEPTIRIIAAFNAGVAPPKRWDDPAALWADDVVGTWSGDSVSLDLTAKADTPGQYRLRLVSPGTSAVEIKGLELSIGDSMQPALARPASGRKDVALLTIPGAHERVTIRVRLRAPGQGTALLQRL